MAQMDEHVRQADLGVPPAQTKLDKPEPKRDRYWIVECNDPALPFGDDTVGVVDEEEGGIIAYTHRSDAGRILENLEFAGLD